MAFLCLLAVLIGASSVGHLLPHWVAVRSRLRESMSSDRPAWISLIARNPGFAISGWVLRNSTIAWVFCGLRTHIACCV